MSRLTELDATPSRHASVQHKIISASIGAMITSVIVTPLDVVKVRLQTQTSSGGHAHTHRCSPSRRHQRPLLAREPSFVYCNRLFDSVEPAFVGPSSYPRSRMMGGKPPFSGLFEGVWYILKHEGTSSLWRGLSPTLMMAIPATVVYFVGYEHLRFSTLWQAAQRDSLTSTYVAPLCSGAIARTLSACTISPLELVRTRMQSTSHTRATFRSVLRDVLHMIQQEGVLSLWRGLWPTLWRDVPFSAIYWLGYERIKQALWYRFSARDASLQGPCPQPSRDVLLSFVAGLFSGTVAAVCTTPFDVAKTRRQIQGLTAHAHLTDTEKSMQKILRRILHEEGWQGLFRGLSARVAKVAPACGIMIASYELGKDLFLQ